MLLKGKMDMSLYHRNDNPSDNGTPDKDSNMGNLRIEDFDGFLPSMGDIPAIRKEIASFKNLISKHGDLIESQKASIKSLNDELVMLRNQLNEISASNCIASQNIQCIPFNKDAELSDDSKINLSPKDKRKIPNRRLTSVFSSLFSMDVDPLSTMTNTKGMSMLGSLNDMSTLSGNNKTEHDEVSSSVKFKPFEQDNIDNSFHEDKYAVLNSGYLPKNDTTRVIKKNKVYNGCPYQGYEMFALVDNMSTLTVKQNLAELSLCLEFNVLSDKEDHNMMRIYPDIDFDYTGYQVDSSECYELDLDFSPLLKNQKYIGVTDVNMSVSSVISIDIILTPSKI